MFHSPFTRILAVLVLGSALAAEAQPGQGPSRVVVGTITRGTLSPATGLEGSVYFKEVSQVATEVSGKVEQVLFEEGQHLDKGAPLIVLDDDLVEAELAAAEALVAQSGAQLAQEEARFQRSKGLLDEEVLTPQEYDDIRFTVESLEYRRAAALAEVQRVRRQLARKTIYAPFDGVVVHRQTELGEWKGAGDVVAVFARDDVFDVIVNVPEEYLPALAPGLPMPVRVAGRAVDGELITVIPRGDVSTRTFPVKIRVTDVAGLFEGMSAVVSVPSGPPVDTLLVPRDAVLLERGQSVVFLIDGGVAKRVPVDVTGYREQLAGVSGDGLTEGAQVVVKGHERLRDGAAVEVIGS